MAGSESLARRADRSSALPPVAAMFSLREIEDPEVGAAPDEFEPELQSIAAFACIIEYDGDHRLITCRRFDLVGELGYVGAICHAARGYRQFRCDRIQTVFDAASGEALGDGSFFHRFEVQSRRERAPTWGLTPNQKAELIAGLNVLAFMARCDGRWHPLETPVIEKFVCSMWLRKEWPGDPPLDEIVAHSQRLAPELGDLLPCPPPLRPQFHLSEGSPAIHWRPYRRRRRDLLGGNKLGLGDRRLLPRECADLRLTPT